MQLIPASPLRTPPLRPFDWWWDFVDFNIPQSPAILQGPSSNPFVRLLAPLGQKINNNEDEHIFRDLVIKSRQEFRCAGCRVHNIISSLILKYLAGDVREPKTFERFVGAAIQKLNEWMELSDYQFGAPSTSVGAALHQLGRNAEALPLLIEGLKDAEPDLSHNDLAQYRLKVALCHLELSQIEDAVEQLRLAFGPEFGRLAILAPDSDYCTQHTTQFNIISKLMEYEESYDPVFLNASELDQIADVEIPAGTFCLEHEIIPISAVDETSTLYSTVFFSNVTLRRMDLALLKSAGALVRKLHLHNATANVGINIDMTGPEVVI
jgi:tetratricopeptide (TPR) repeat protein